MDEVLAGKYEKAEEMATKIGFEITKTHPDTWHGKMPENEKAHCCIRKAIGTSEPKVHLEVEF